MDPTIESDRQATEAEAHQREVHLMPPIGVIIGPHVSRACPTAPWGPSLVAMTAITAELRERSIGGAERRGPCTLVPRHAGGSVPSPGRERTCE